MREKTEKIKIKWNFELSIELYRIWRRLSFSFKIFVFFFGFIFILILFFLFLFFFAAVVHAATFFSVTTNQYCIHQPLPPLPKNFFLREGRQSKIRKENSQLMYVSEHIHIYTNVCFTFTLTYKIYLELNTP